MAVSSARPRPRYTAIPSGDRWIAYLQCEDCQRATQNGAGREIDVGLEVLERASCDAKILGSLDEDARWHRAWTTALLRYLIDDTPANAEVISGWIGKWSPLASRALEAFAGTLAEAPVPLDADAITARITSDVSRDTDSVLLN